ncbi:MAG: hypothetical protein K5984_00715 [Bacteroidales bacterium]|nr:hypothetical protein [Bacteroidales bacterium]
MKIGYLLIRGALKTLGCLPLKFHYACAKVISFILCDIVRYRRNVVMINLSRAFPTKRYDEIVDIARKSYDHLARLIVEMIWFGASSEKRLHDSHIAEFKNPELLAEVYEKSSSVLVLNSHLGNWEITGGFFCYNYSDTKIPFGYSDSYVVYKGLRSPVWNDVFAASRKSAAGQDYKGYIESNMVIREAVRNRGVKKIYIFPTDQSPYAGASVHHVKDFMHQRTVTMTGAGQLAHKFGWAVMEMFINLREDGGYEIEFEKICDDGSQLSPEDIMNLFYEKLQVRIEKQPWNYNWTHKRWKNND